MKTAGRASADIAAAGAGSCGVIVSDCFWQRDDSTCEPVHFDESMKVSGMRRPFRPARSKKGCTMRNNKVLLGIMILGTALAGACSDNGTGTQGSGGAGGSSSGAPGTGGDQGTGGSSNMGGAMGSGGSVASGGNIGSGGATGTGGATGAGGNASGGSIGSGGNAARGGAIGGTGGRSDGSSATGGTTGTTGGATATGGTTGGKGGTTASGGTTGGATGGKGGATGGATGGTGTGGTTGNTGGATGGATGGSGGATGGLPALHVDGPLIKDPNGKTIVLRGYALIDIGSLYLQTNSATGITQRIDAIAAAGFDAHLVRMPVYPQTDFNHDRSLLFGLALPSRHSGAGRAKGDRHDRAGLHKQGPQAGD